MNEGSHEKFKQEENELTQEQEEAVETLFSGGKPRTEEENLLYKYVTMRLATGDIETNLGDIVKEFHEERTKAIGTGIDPKQYIINKSGTVLTDSEARPQ